MLKEGFELIEDSLKSLSINDKEKQPERSNDNMTEIINETQPGTSKNITQTTVYSDITAHNIENETITLNQSFSLTSMNGNFKMLLFEQGLKAFVILYLSIGIVSAVVYLGRQIVVAPESANYTWRWVGLLKCVVSISATVVILWSKLLIDRNDYLESAKPENAGFYYSIIMISALVSLLHLLLTELRNFQFWTKCAVIPDLLFPILQMIFIMVGVLLLSNLLFHKIKPDVPNYFYVIYKSAAVLLFVNCINCLIFDIFDIESTYLQDFISSKNNKSKDVYCYHTNITNGFFKLLQDVRPFFEVFTVILFISIIGALLKPIQQFANSMTKANLILSFDQNDRLPPGEVIKYDSSSIIYGTIVFIIAIIGIPLDVLSLNPSQHTLHSQSTQIAFSVLPLFLLITLGCFSAFLLKWLYDNYPSEYDKDISKVDYIIIWASLCGHLIACFKFIINSSQYLTEGPKAVPILRIVLYCTDIIQSMLQAIILDFINNVKQVYPIRNVPFNWITYPVHLLMSMNVGLAISDLYLISNLSSFKVNNNPFNIIVWDIFSCISNALSLIFRGYSAIFLLRFLSRFRSRYH